MRAISSFNREAGTSTFWWRAWSALRTRVNISATGSVNLIVCFSSIRPFAPRPAENLRRLVLQSFVVSSRLLACQLAVANDQRPAANNALPRRLGNPWNLTAQRELPEAQPADTELAQIGARASAKLAAVVLARGELRLSCVLDSFCCSSHSILVRL